MMWNRVWGALDGSSLGVFEDEDVCSQGGLDNWLFHLSELIIATIQ